MLKNCKTRERKVERENKPCPIFNPESALLIASPRTSYIPSLALFYFKSKIKNQKSKSKSKSKK